MKMMNSVEHNNRFLLGARATLVQNEKEIAWAERHVRHDPQLKWILGNFVEADNANENGHIFPLEDLKVARNTIPNKPLNMLHHENYIVGAFAAAELLFPEGEEAAAVEDQPHPLVEALAAFWKHQFPEEFRLVERAHSEGALYYSMEAIPESLNCTAEGCRFKETAVAYAGRTSDTYCDHMNKPAGEKVLNKPHFGAGALIVPPVKPGWKRADINELSALLVQHADEAEAVHANLQSDLPHLDDKQWTHMMEMIMLRAKQE